MSKTIRSTAMIASFFVALIIFAVGCGLTTILTVGLGLELSGRTIYARPMARTWLSAALGLTLGILYWTVRSIRAIDAGMLRDARSTPAIPIPMEPRLELWDRDLDGGIWRPNRG